MAERYSQLFTLPANLYTEGSPVLIEAGALLRDNVTGGVLAQLKIKSISNKIIKALTVGIIPYDVAERQLSDAVMHQYLDLSLGRDSEFGQKNAIALPDPATRSFKVYVSELVFDGNSIYSFTKNEWVSLDIAKVPVSQILNDDVELIKQFHATYGAQYKYLPKRERCLWLCSCGSINHDDEANCHNCGQEYMPFEKVDITALKTARDERVAEERRQANEATRLAKTKRKKILSITLPVVAVCIAFVIVFITVFIPKIKLNKAISILDSGDYDSAHELLEEIGDKGTTNSSRYNKALEYIDSSDYEAAYILLNAMAYKDSEDKLQSIKTKYQQTLFAKANVGDTVCFGAYEQDNDTSNGKEDIEWLVLAKENNNVLIISDKALDCQPYNASDEDATWETCSLRKWINDTFLNTAFSTEEQTIIQSTNVSAGKNPECITNPGNATTDKVFLLSIDEANKYFSSNEARKCIPTSYAEEDEHWTMDDDYTKDDKFCIWWWTRSPGYYQSAAVFIYNDGGIVYNGFPVYADIFVRPAMWISTED